MFCFTNQVLIEACRENNIKFSCCHISRYDNIAADKLSKQNDQYFLSMVPNAWSKPKKPKKPWFSLPLSDAERCAEMLITSNIEDNAADNSVFRDSVDKHGCDKSKVASQELVDRDSSCLSDNSAAGEEGDRTKTGCKHKDL